MTRHKWAGVRRLDVSLAIDTTNVDALWRDRLDREQRWSSTFDGALPSAFDALAVALGGSARVRLFVTVMPPLSMIRRVELPRMSSEERRLVIARQAERWFLSAGEPLATSHRVLSARRGKTSAILVAAAPNKIIEAIYGAASARGWTVETILPAQIAWHRFAPPRMDVVVCGPSELSLLEHTHGRLSGVRRCRLGSFTDLADVLRGSAIVLGNAEDRRAITTSVPATSADEGAEDATIAALRGLRKATADDCALGLTTEAQRIAIQRRATRYSLAIVAAAAVLCLAAAGLELVGVHRQLAVVRAARRADHARVEQAMALRDSLTVVVSRLETLSSLEAQSPRWSAVIARVAERLPADAHVVGFHTVGDSLVLDGQAENAAGVFTALHDGAGLSSITAAAPIRQEVMPGQPTVEHWTMLARVTAPAKGGR